MSVAAQSVLKFWVKASIAIRRQLMIDYVLASVLIGWGAAAIIFPNAIVNGSRFGSLRDYIELAGTIVLSSGLLHAAGAKSGKHKWRRRSAFVAFWAMLSLWFAVDTLSGKMVWGGDVVLYALICLALVP